MILILNAGSTSLKFKLFQVQNNDLILLESDSLDVEKRDGINNYFHATKLIFDKLSKYYDKIHHTGYRIVFGGENARDGENIDAAFIQRLKKLSKQAPLHNPAALQVLKSSIKYLPEAKHLAFYDTTFFNKLPTSEKIIPIDKHTAKQLNIRRYGFHGISHRYAYQNCQAGKYQKVVTVHIGAGSSVAAIKDGEPVATSMAFTPLSGVPMLKRCGDIDPGVVTYMISKIGLKKTNEILNHRSGMCGIIGKTLSVFDILRIAGEKVEDNSYKSTLSEPTQQEQQEAKQALDYFCNRIKQFIGSYAAIMNGLETIIFTGKAGAGSSVIRDKICYGLDYLALKEVAIVHPDEESAIAGMILNQIKV